MTLNKAAYSDSLNFYIAADSGKILRSTDAGISWSTYNTGILSNIIDITFLNVSTGFAIAWEFGLNNPNFIGSIVLKTTNAGVSWNPNYKVDTNVFYSRMKFVNNTQGFLVGEGVGILRTSNAGDTWAADHIDSATFYDFPVRNIKTYGNVGLACGGWIDIQGVIWRTTNNGVNWIAKGVSPEPLYDIHYFDANRIIAVGGDFEYGASMAVSSNGGNDWEYIALEEFGIAQALAFRTPSEGWMPLGIGQKFFYTMNGGANWTSWLTPNGEVIFDAVFSNKRNGIAVGKNGAILKFNTAYVNVENTGEVLPSEISLKQNYPNPFNPETVITFTLQKPEYVSLKIFDMLGREVKILIDGMKPPGEYKMKFSAKELPAGIYYYTLRAGENFRQTKKMALVK